MLTHSTLASSQNHIVWPHQQFYSTCSEHLLFLSVQNCSLFFWQTVPYIPLGNFLSIYSVPTTSILCSSCGAVTLSLMPRDGHRIPARAINMSHPLVKLPAHRRAQAGPPGAVPLYFIYSERARSFPLLLGSVNWDAVNLNFCDYFSRSTLPPALVQHPSVV